jgi:hypothetical protein
LHSVSKLNPAYFFNFFNSINVGSVLVFLLPLFLYSPSKYVFFCVLVDFISPPVILVLSSPFFNVAQLYYHIKQVRMGV